MKQYIKDNKIYNLPIEIKKDGNTVIYTNSKKYCLKMDLKNTFLL